jgi:hypothetical protein
MKSEYYYQIIASLPGATKKTIINKTETQVMEYVISFLSNGTIRASWGGKSNSYQVYELRVHKTKAKYNKNTGKTIEKFLSGNQNIYYVFEKRAKQLIEHNEYRVFIIMLIQGKEFGNQNEQRIYKEFDNRFNKIKYMLQKYNSIAIRIDKEFPLEQLVGRIKQEIEDATFIISDLTEERPSCYFEAGYAEALRKNIVYIASEYGIINTSEKTKIHFDVHMNVNFFSNLDEMEKKISAVIEKNHDKLFEVEKESGLRQL